MISTQSITARYNKLYHKVLAKIFSKRKEFFSENFKVLYSKYIYYAFTGKYLNLRNPQSISDKIMWLKLYYTDPLINQCTDKYAVREYIINKEASHLLNDLYGVYNSVEDINFDELPNQFVLKATHGCGYNIICKDKNSLNLFETKEKLNTWINSVYGIKYGEWHYSEIKPRIICEKYLSELDNSKSIIDYKIQCFNGTPFCFLIVYDRSQRPVKLSSYDLKWNRLNLLKEEGEDLPPPENLDLMVKYAAKLSAPFPYVRVDFYEIKGKLYFGELTFTPLGGMQDIDYTDDTLILMGNQLKLPEKNTTRIPFIK